GPNDAPLYPTALFHQLDEEEADGLVWVRRIGRRAIKIRRAIFDAPGNRLTVDDNEPGVVVAVLGEFPIVDDAVECLAFGSGRQRVEVSRHQHAAAHREGAAKVIVQDTYPLQARHTPSSQKSLFTSKVTAAKHVQWGSAVA